MTKGSQAQQARVEIQGVPADGVIDSGVDITIVGGSFFKRIARLKNFHKADKVPRTYI